MSRGWLNYFRTMNCCTTRDSWTIKIQTRMRSYEIKFVQRTTWRRLPVRDGSRARENLISQIDLAKKTFGCLHTHIVCHHSSILKSVFKPAHEATMSRQPDAALSAEESDYPPVGEPGTMASISAGSRHGLIEEPLRLFGIYPTRHRAHPPSNLVQPHH